MLVLCLTAVTICLLLCHLQAYCCDTRIKVLTLQYRVYPLCYHREARNGYKQLDYIVSEWEEVMRSIPKFHSNDTRFKSADPYPIDSISNAHIDVCTVRTYLLMIYPSRLRDSGIRLLIRQYIPQSISVMGRIINRVFVIAVDDNDREELRVIRNESSVFGDIIVSHHKDSLSLIAQTVWDGLIWAREHCSEARFVGKFDPDTIVFLGNLISLLQTVNTSRFFGGRERTFHIRAYKDGDRYFYFPRDYPYERIVYYVSGPAEIMSQDTLNYAIEGASFEPVFAMNTDDFMLGAILNRVGIFPFKLRNTGCRFMLYNEEVKIDGDYGLLPNNTCVFHHVKQEQSLRSAIQVLNNRLYKPFC